VRALRALEPGAAQPIGQPRQAPRQFAVRLADQQLRMGVVPHDARAIERGREIDRAADDALRRDRPRDRPVGIDGSQSPAGPPAPGPQRASGPLWLAKTPPGTPFIAVTTAVSGPSNGPIADATSVMAGAFTAMMT